MQHVGGYGGQRHLPVVKTPTLHIEFKKNVDDGQLRIDLSNVQCFMSDPNQVGCLLELSVVSQWFR